MAARHFGKATVLSGTHQKTGVELAVGDLEHIHTPILGCIAVPVRCTTLEDPIALAILGPMNMKRKELGSPAFDAEREGGSPKIAAMKKNNLLKLLGIALVVAIVSTGIFYGLFVNS